MPSSTTVDRLAPSSNGHFSRPEAREPAPVDPHEGRGLASVTKLPSQLIRQSARQADPNRVIKIITPALAPAAYYGLAGEFLRAVADYTEASDAAVLAHLLPAVGTLIGPGPYVFAGGKQPARVNAVVVGPTNSGRKGTALGPVDLLLERVAGRFWWVQRVGGLSSGEGLIQKVADTREKDAKGKTIITKVEKRLYVIEPELSRVLANIRRDGNVLSQIIREAYDSGNLSTLTVNPRQAFGAHISIVAHITPEELRERLDRIEMANGFGNRFLWFYVESEKLLPQTDPIPSKLFVPFQKRLGTLLHLGDGGKQFAVKLDARSKATWEHVYPYLREDQPGMSGAMTARGSSIVLRLALIYRLLDEVAKKPIRIASDHLEAALAVWRYSEESARQLFTEDEDRDALADKLLEMLRERPMTRSEMNNHLSKKQKEAATATLERMEEKGLVQQITVKKKSGAGRPATKWKYVPAP